MDWNSSTVSLEQPLLQPAHGFQRVVSVSESGETEKTLATGSEPHTGSPYYIDFVKQFVNRFGMIGAMIFVLIQIVQVVFPIIPGGISCLAGVLLFGAVPGFFYNYIGICVGSCIAFGIARSLGRPVLYKMFPGKMIEKYLTWTELKGRFLKLFTLAIFLPVAPDDFLCYLAGTTNMTWKQFVTVIFLGKPFSIALYSLGLTTLFQVIFHLL